MATTTNSPNNRARAAWLWCLASAFRTALACTIVGCTTLFGPTYLQHQIAFPAFSYVTVILIVTDATLGDAIHGCWLALYATIQSIGPALLSFWLIGPARFSSGTISLAVALAAFVVALPEGSHLIAKRIALGQIVIVYVIGFINGVNTEAIMHPLHVATSTAIGVLACVLALLLPYPRLAYWEITSRSFSKLKLKKKQITWISSGGSTVPTISGFNLKKARNGLAENASERLKFYVKAFCAGDNAMASASHSQAKPLATAGAKFLQSIQRYHGSVKWEILPWKFSKTVYMNPAETLQELEIPLKGMEMALTSTSSFPVKFLDEESKQGLVQIEEHLGHSLKQTIKNCLPSNSSTVPESNAKSIIESLQTLQTIPTNHQDLPSLFFLFCLKLFRSKLSEKPITNIQQNKESSPSCKQKVSFDSLLSYWSSISPNKKRLMPALKCSVSLGLSILFGLIYSKENGFWSGLPVAISIAAAREATFKVANVKAQGTVLGTVYGVFGCFVFGKYLAIRFASLLPWFLVTSFLRRSKMYGQAGGISAVIGAVLVLGRKNFGKPSEFAIARIAETFIGLFCSVMVDLLFQPTRASSLAKVQLSKCFGTLSSCVGSLSLDGSTEMNLVEHQRRLKLDVSELSKFIGEAEVEPNFWFLPFHSACYSKLLESLSKLVDLLLFSAHAVRLLEREPRWKEFVNKLDGDIESFKDMVGSMVKCFEDVTLLKSLAFLEKELENKRMSCDLELGKSSNRSGFAVLSLEEHKTDNIMSSYLHHSKEIVDKFHAADEGGQEVKSQMVLGLSALGFCMRNLTQELTEIQKGINELLQWENPSNHINLYEISSKIRSVCD